MKYLTDYVKDGQTKAFNKADAFFAFSDKQFNEEKKEGIKYVDLGAGLICNKLKAKQLVEDISLIHKNGIKQDIIENGIDNIIKRELENHEAYYANDIESTTEALTDYPITNNQIIKVFKDNQPITQ